jgi:Zn-dependent M28 family amino/carboxypeptidase
MFVAFNREEDGLLGNQDFVNHYLHKTNLDQAHIFEMVGYCQHGAQSQKLPSGLPVSLPDTGDFLFGAKNSRFDVDRYC